jgi:hypothetical protein
MMISTGKKKNQMVLSAKWDELVFMWK